MSISRLQFNGIDGHIDIGNDDAFNMATSDFSLCFYGSIPTGTYCLFDLLNINWKGWYLETFLSGGTYYLSFVYAVSSINFGYHDTAYTSETNHFYCWTVNRATKTVSLYIDSVLTAATDTGAITTDGSISNTTGFYIGMEWRDTALPPAFQFPFSGTLGNVLIAKKVLSEAEIGQIYNDGAGTTFDKTFVNSLGVDCWYMNLNEGSGNPSGTKYVFSTDTESALNGTMTSGVSWIAETIAKKESSMSMENNIYTGGGMDEKCAVKSLVGIAHGLQNLFVISGLIQVVELVGIVKTAIQSASCLINYSMDPTSPAGDTAFGKDVTAVEMNAAAIGTIITWAGVVAANLVITANGVALGMPAPRLLLPTGSLELAAVNAGGTAKTGDIDFYIRYKPMIAGATVVAA